MEKKTKIIGTTIGLAAIAAAGAYFFGGKRGAKNRKKVQDWAEKMKEEVIEQMRHLKDINKETFERIVDETATKYRRATKVSAEEIRFAGSEIKKAWSHISEHVASAVHNGAHS